MITVDNTPLLSQDELLGYVDKHFSLGKTYLSKIQGHRLPLYLLDTSILKERAFQFKNAFTDALPKVDFYFAVKSNNHPDVAATLLANGFGLEVSSGLELEMALGLGAGNIVFSGPGKTHNELLLAVRNSDKVTVLMDSFGELSRLQDIAEKEGRTISAGVRLAASSKWNKFGISPTELYFFWRKARECSRIRFRGIQFHTSWNLTSEAQCDFIERLGTILSGMPARFREKIKFLDVGGGYWPHGGEWLQPSVIRDRKLDIMQGDLNETARLHYRKHSMPIKVFSERLARAIKKHIFPSVDCRICFEPGRWICNDAMHLLITVIDKKSRNVVITDAGTNAVGWDRFEMDYCPVLNLTRPSMEEKPCNILGSLCTPHDIWGFTYFGDSIMEGDVLMIPCQGAYTYSLRQYFIKPVPKFYAF